MTQDEVQELIDLNPAQKKAFNSLIRAVNKCRKENVYFYQVLESLHALNGDNVDAVVCPDDLLYKGCNTSGHDEERNLQFLSFPTIDTTCSFADDTHYVVLEA